MTTVSTAIVDLPEPDEDEDALVKNGRYRIYMQPGDDKPKLFIRSTTWADTLDDTSNLDKWRARGIAKGLAQRTDLVEYIIATPDDDKDTLNRLVEDAMTVAGYDVKRNRGSGAHGFFARVLAGETVDIPASTVSNIEAAVDCLAKHGFTPLLDMIEAVVVCAELGVAGRTDLVCTTQDGELVVVDLKTGRQLEEYARLKTAIQLAVYAHAETVYDPATRTHRPMPAVRQDIAYVVHRPIDSDTCQLIKVDIAAGWKYASETVPACRAARNHGKRKSDSLLEIVPEPCGEIQPEDLLPPAELAKWNARQEPDPDPIHVVTPGFRNVIIRRIEELKANNAEAAQLLRDRWPHGVPSMKGDHVHTDVELQRIIGALEAAEAEASAKNTGPDEGRMMKPQDVTAIRARIDDLPPEQRAVLNGWAKDANAAGVGFSLGERPSQRRFEIYRACLELAHLIEPLIEDELDLCRATVAAVIPDAAQPTIPLGNAIGALTIAEAELLVRVAQAARTENPALQYDPDNGAVTWRWPDDANPTNQTAEQDQTA